MFGFCLELRTWYKACQSESFLSNQPSYCTLARGSLGGGSLTTQADVAEGPASAVDKATPVYRDLFLPAGSLNAAVGKAKKQSKIMIKAVLAFRSWVVVGRGVAAAAAAAATTTDGDDDDDDDGDGCSRPPLPGTRCSKGYTTVVISGCNAAMLLPTFGLTFLHKI